MYLCTHPYVIHTEELLHTYQVHIHHTVFVYFSSIASAQTDLGKLDLQIYFKCVLIP